jgi:hypothetical protein
MHILTTLPDFNGLIDTSRNDVWIGFVEIYENKEIQ